jgi:hypothetical protein
VVALGTDRDYSTIEGLESALKEGKNVGTLYDGDYV